MRMATMQFQAKSVCNRKYSGGLSDQQLCVGDGQPSTCSGDSGGPLTCKRSDNRNYVLGVVSWGAATCGRNGAPSVFARFVLFYRPLKISTLNSVCRVCSVMSWIKDTMARN